MPTEILHSGSPLSKASKALILLHGRGATAEGILSLADVFCDESYYVAAPQAPDRTWYPYSFMEEEKLNEPWLSLSIEIVRKLIDETARHILQHQIYLMGFSQGACLALEVSARFAAKFGGVIAFSGGLIGNVIDERKYHGHFQGTKVFIGTSDKDPHVPVIRAEESKEMMEKRGANATLIVYKGMGHTITQEEIDWVKQNIMPI
jgi:phospholipase/carboxylesterase